MIEKICSHCRATLLVGLQYCPGCLRPIESRQIDRFEDTSEDYTESGKIHPDTMLRDLKVVWSQLTYPLRAAVCRLFRRPEPADPAPSPTNYRRDESRFSIRNNQAARISFSNGYTRIVCPQCQRAQNASLSVSPSDVITCEFCNCSFPGSFAAEFRRGVDLHCYRCGVTTFCVSGLKITTCPNCRAASQATQAKTRLKPVVLAALPISLIVIGLVFAVLTRTTTQYLVWLSVTCVGSSVGFVTLAALGF